jgi:hypothetical protein
MQAITYNPIPSSRIAFTTAVGRLGPPQLAASVCAASLDHLVGTGELHRWIFSALVSRPMRARELEPPAAL